MALSNDIICRIEGHGSIKIDLLKNRAQLKVFEGERLFEGILVGRSAADAHWITPRICGVCPIVHNLTTIIAAENAYGIVPSPQARQLRRVMMAAQMIESHILHLFFLAMPDYLEINRGTDLAYKEPNLFAAVLELKKLSDEIVEVIGGRPIHPVTTKIGGFHRYPKKKELELLVEKIQKVSKSAEHCLEVVAAQRYPELEGNHYLLASSDQSSFYTPTNASEVKESQGSCFKVSEYREKISEEVVAGSTAKFGKFKGGGLMVGALARQEIVGGRTLRGLKKLKVEMDSRNPFHNNIAQAVEVVHFLEEAKIILSELLKQYRPDQVDVDINLAKARAKDPDPVRGIGALEAPRGTLYYELHFDDRGLVEFCNIITPTVQNLTSIEENANLLLEANRSKSAEDKRHLLEMLIRAYDPCITCSVH